MRQAHALQLNRLCRSILWQRRSALLLCLLIPVLAWVLPLLTPWQTQGSLLQPARIQTCWTLLWLSLAFYFIFQAASLGRSLSSWGLLEHAAAAQHPLRRAVLPVLAAVGLWLNLALAAALGLCWLLRPSQAIESSLWLPLLLQQALLFEIVAMGLLGLAAALGTRFSAAVACFVSLAVLFCGWALGPWMEAWCLQQLPSSLGGLAATLLPRQDLADLLPRMVFKLGPLPAATFLQVSAILGLQSLALLLAASALCRCHGR